MDKLEKIIKEYSYREDSYASKLLKVGKKAKRRGWLKKSEFIAMCMWKSPRPKPRYISNSEAKIKDVTKKVLSTNYEMRKIKLLCSLNGVSVPVASSILMFLDPKHYGVIDIRAWQTLYKLGKISKKPTGLGLSSKNLYHYLQKIRYYANKYHTTPRKIEKALYYYHQKEIQRGRLYKNQ